MDDEEGARNQLLESVYACISDAHYEQTDPQELKDDVIREITLYLVDNLKLRSFEQLLLATEDDLMATGHLSVFDARSMLQKWKNWQNGDNDSYYLLVLN